MIIIYSSNGLIEHDCIASSFFSPFRGLMNITEFDSSYVGFTQDGAQFLVDNTDIKLVGKTKHSQCILLTNFSSYTLIFLFGFSLTDLSFSS